MIKSWYNNPLIGWLIILLSIIGLISNLYSFVMAVSVIELITRIFLAAINYISFFMGFDLAFKTKVMSFNNSHAEVAMLINEIEIAQKEQDNFRCVK